MNGCVVKGWHDDGCTVIGDLEVGNLDVGKTVVGDSELGVLEVGECVNGCVVTG